MGYKDRATNSISSNNLKLTADKIIQVLDQVREEGQKSKRRWIWELMQNAKDVPNKFGKVSVEVTLTGDSLTFAHNGDAFRIEDLTGIIQQVSSKPSGSQDQKITGKFGTGFIATHLLSDIVTIRGIVEENEELPKKFSLDLDRSGKTSEEMIPAVREVLLKLDNIEEEPSFETFTEYNNARNEEDYYTSFTYKLLSESALRTAQVGISDLTATLPTALVFLDSIKQVRIIDRINGSTLLYKNETAGKTTGEYNEVAISISDELHNAEPDIRNFILKTNGDIQLVTQITDFENYELVTIPDALPFIYRDFPLIGTEKFYFPFIFNGKTLFPTERRDSIFLNGDSAKAFHNKGLLEQAIENAVSFVDFLIEKKATALYNVCLSRLPDYNFDEEFKTEDWYKKSIQKRYRSQLINKKIIGKGIENFYLKDVRFPTTNEQNLPELRSLISEYLGQTRVPYLEEQEQWVHFLGPDAEMDSWELKLGYGVDDLVHDIDRHEDFVTNPCKVIEPFQWLNQLYVLLEKTGNSNLHFAHKLVPNHKSQLRKLASLYKEEMADDDNSYLPDAFLEILEDLGKDWYSDIIHRDIVINKKDHQKRNMSDLNKAINDIFRSEGYIDNTNALEILLKANSVVTLNSKEDSFQRILLKIASELFGKPENLAYEQNPSAYNYEIPQKLIVSLMNKRLEAIGSIKELSVVLAVTQTQATIWLDYYLRLLQDKADYPKFLKEGNVIPNRTQDNIFSHFDRIYNYGTTDNPLDDKLLIILATLNPQKNYFEKLLADGIGIKMPDTLTKEGLINDVVLEIEAIERNKTYEQHREALLDLINWVENNIFWTSKYAGNLVLVSNRLFYILTVENNSYREGVMKILKNQNNIKILAKLSENDTILGQVEKLTELFPEGIPNKVLAFAEEENRKKKDFHNMLEIGSEVERVLMSTLNGYEINVDHKIIKAGGGPYDIRIHNPVNKKSYLIEVKSVHHNNEEPISMAISQVKRAVKEEFAFSLVVIERPIDRALLNEKYIEENLLFVKNPGRLLREIADDHNLIDLKSNTDKDVDLKMENAEFKGSVNYGLIKSQSMGFGDLIAEIERLLK